MPIGDYWFPHPPQFRMLPIDRPYWHLYPEFGKDKNPIHPLSANPVSQARLALRNPRDPHSMFYLGDSLTGVLWETVLRWTEPLPNGDVSYDTREFSGQRVVRLRLKKPDVPWYPLTQPDVRTFGHATKSVTWKKIQRILQTRDHSATHAPARALRTALRRHGHNQMPVLSWASCQHAQSTVFLAYEPPTHSSWWEIEEEPCRLDTPMGIALIRSELASAGFNLLAPLYDPVATPPPPLDGT